MYRNELYKQRDGGAIGLRLTGVVAQLVMDRWIQVLKKKLREADVRLHMIRKYVDDVNLVISIIDMTDLALTVQRVWENDLMLVLISPISSFNFSNFACLFGLF